MQYQKEKIGIVPRVLHSLCRKPLVVFLHAKIDGKCPENASGERIL